MSNYQSSALSVRQIRSATRAIWSNSEIHAAHAQDPHFSDKFTVERTTSDFVGDDESFQFLVRNKQGVCVLPPILSPKRRPRNWQPGY